MGRESGTAAPPRPQRRGLMPRPTATEASLAPNRQPALRRHTRHALTQEERHQLGHPRDVQRQVVQARQQAGEAQGGLRRWRVGGGGWSSQGGRRGRNSTANDKEAGHSLPRRGTASRGSITRLPARPPTQAAARPPTHPSSPLHQPTQRGPHLILADHARHQVGQQHRHELPLPRLAVHGQLHRLRQGGRVGEGGRGTAGVGGGRGRATDKPGRVRVRSLRCNACKHAACMHECMDARA